MRAWGALTFLCVSYWYILTSLFLDTEDMLEIPVGECGILESINIIGGPADLVVDLSVVVDPIAAAAASGAADASTVVDAAAILAAFKFVATQSIAAYKLPLLLP